MLTFLFPQVALDSIFLGMLSNGVIAILRQGINILKKNGDWIAKNQLGDNWMIEFLGQFGFLGQIPI